MRFEEPIGHAAAIAGLWNAAQSDRLAHALCFAGPAGIGKFLAAEWLTLGLLCRGGAAAREPFLRAPGIHEPGLHDAGLKDVRAHYESSHESLVHESSAHESSPHEPGVREIGPPCGRCGPCKRARADTHPDVFVIDLESENREQDPKQREEQIRVHRIARRSQDGETALADFLALRAAEGGYRIVLVREADRANEEAQNALLKTLEEPGARTLIVLETARAEMLLPTIRSRCVKVELHAPEPGTTARILAAHGLAPAEAEALARWSGGAPGLALSLHGRGVAPMRALLEGLMSGASDAFSAAAEVGEIEGDFQSKTPLAGERIRVRTFLDLVLAVLRDRERAAAGLVLADLPHGDLVGRLPMPNAGRRAVQLEQCLRARQDVDHNLSPEAALERALLALDSLSKGNLAAC